MMLSFRQFYWRWLKNQIFLFLFFALVMSAARAGFALTFGDVHSLAARSAELKQAFWLGFRFDLMPLAYIHALPFLLLNLGYFLPGKRAIKILRSLIVAILTAGSFALGWIYVFDYGFYSYFQEHMNILVFGFFEDDTRALLTSIYKNYNLPLWLSLLGILHYVVFQFIKLLFSPFDFDLKPHNFSWKMPGAFLLGLVSLAFAARGNFTRLPLSLEDAHLSEDEFINEIALNGALTLNRAWKIRKTFGRGEYDFLSAGGFKDWKEAYRAYTGSSPASESIVDSLKTVSAANLAAKKNPPHVVLVVMESFGTYWNNADTRNFQILGELKDHLAEGILFKNFLPAENGTIGSIVSTAVSQAIRPGARFLSESEFMKTALRSSGHKPFKENGYETHFVYGGKLGWRELGKYLRFQGYDKLWGADEIREAMPELNNLSPSDLGNEWGIFDEYLYTFIEEHLRTSTKPQFFLVLTTSNHPPFEYPSSYNPLPLELTNEIQSKLSVSDDRAKKRFLGLQYANQKMGEFLSRIKTSSLHEKTIAAFTGDHSFWIAKGVGLEEEFRRYAVPFFIKAPEKYLPASFDANNFGSHEDIFPTLYHLALSEASYVKLGENLFTEKGLAMNSSGLFASDEGAWHHGKFWKWTDKNSLLLEASEPAPELEAIRLRGQGLIGLTDSYLKAEKIGKPSAGESGQQ